MSKQWQIRRGTSAENNEFTGAQGEITMDTDKNQIRLHDGVTQGGMPFGDTVIEWQLPTADNGYTWYRKYASGWIEQGGYYVYTTSDVNFQIVLPESMESANYTVITTLRNNNTNAGFVNVDVTGGISATGFYCRIVNKANAACSPLGVFWQVSGMAA